MSTMANTQGASDDSVHVRSMAFSGPVSALRFVERARGAWLLLVGVGRALHVHDVASGGLLCAGAVLEHAWVHALDAVGAPGGGGQLVLVSGGRELALVLATPADQLVVLWRRRFPAWILSATADDLPAEAEAAVLVRVGFISNRLELWRVHVGADAGPAPALVACCAFQGGARAAAFCLSAQPLAAARVGSARCGWHERVVASGTVMGDLLFWAPGAADTPGGGREAGAPPCAPAEPLCVLRRAHEGAIFAIAWHASGLRLATVSDDRRCALWQWSGRTAQRAPSAVRLRAWFAHRARPWAVAFVDWATVASGGEDCVAKVWAAAEAEEGGGSDEPAVALPGHAGAGVRALAVSAAGREGGGGEGGAAYVATGGADASVRLWRLRGEPRASAGSGGGGDAEGGGRQGQGRCGRGSWDVCAAEGERFCLPAPEPEPAAEPACAPRCGAERAEAAQPQPQPHARRQRITAVRLLPSGTAAIVAASDGAVLAVTLPAAPPSQPQQPPQPPPREPAARGGEGTCGGGRPFASAVPLLRARGSSFTLLSDAWAFPAAAPAGDATAAAARAQGAGAAAAARAPEVGAAAAALRLPLLLGCGAADGTVALLLLARGEAGLAGAPAQPQPQPQPQGEEAARAAAALGARVLLSWGCADGRVTSIEWLPGAGGSILVGASEPDGHGGGSGRAADLVFTASAGAGAGGRGGGRGAVSVWSLPPLQLLASGHTGNAPATASLVARLACAGGPGEWPFALLPLCAGGALSWGGSRGTLGVAWADEARGGWRSEVLPRAHGSSTLSCLVHAPLGARGLPGLGLGAGGEAGGAGGEAAEAGGAFLSGGCDGRVHLFDARAVIALTTARAQAAAEAEAACALGPRRAAEPPGACVRPVRTLRCPSAGIEALALSAAAPPSAGPPRLLALCCERGALSVWELGARALLARLPMGGGVRRALSLRLAPRLPWRPPELSAHASAASSPGPQIAVADGASLVVVGRFGGGGGGADGGAESGDGALTAPRPPPAPGAASPGSASLPAWSSAGGAPLAWAASGPARLLRAQGHGLKAYAAQILAITRGGSSGISLGLAHGSSSGDGCSGDCGGPVRVLVASGAEDGTILVSAHALPPGTAPAVGGPPSAGCAPPDSPLRSLGALVPVSGSVHGHPTGVRALVAVRAGAEEEEEEEEEESGGGHALLLSGGGRSALHAWQASWQPAGAAGAGGAHGPATASVSVAELARTGGQARGGARSNGAESRQLALAALPLAALAHLAASPEGAPPAPAGERSEPRGAAIVAAGASDGLARLSLLRARSGGGGGASELVPLGEARPGAGPVLSLALSVLRGNGGDGSDGSDTRAAAGPAAAAAAAGEGALLLLLVGTTDGLLRAFDATPCALVALALAAGGGAAIETAALSCLLAVRVHASGVNALSSVAPADCRGCAARAARRGGGRTRPRACLRVGCGGDDQSLALLCLELAPKRPGHDPATRVLSEPAARVPGARVRVARGVRLLRAHGASVRGVQLSCCARRGCAGRIVSTGPDQWLAVRAVRWDRLPPPAVEPPAQVEGGAEGEGRCDGGAVVELRCADAQPEDPPPADPSEPDGSGAPPSPPLRGVAVVEARAHTAVQHANALDVARRGGRTVAVVAGEGLELFELTGGADE